MNSVPRTPYHIITLSYPKLQRRIILSFLIILLLSSACNNNKNEDFRFVILADRTGGARDGVFEESIKATNLLCPDFVLSVGDIIEGYTEDKKEIYRQWAEFDTIASKLNSPLFYVPGNHDYTNQTMADIWQEKFKHSYYHTVYNDVLFLFMNSEETLKGSKSTTIEKAQYEYFKEILNKYSEVSHTFIILHKPLWRYDDSGYWKDLEQLFSKRKHSVITGHGHYYVNYNRYESDYIMLSTTGGGWLNRSPIGEFDHITLVSMQNGNPIFANITLDGIRDKDYITEEFHDISLINPLNFDATFSNKEIKAKDYYNIYIHNTSTETMVLNVDFPYHPNFTFPLKPYHNILHPEMKDTIVVRRKRYVDAYSGIPPITTSVNFMMEGHEKTSVNKSFFWKQQIANYCNRNNKPVVVDGSLTEWDELNYTIPKKNGKIAAIFDVKCDESYLYLATEVYDNSSIIGEDVYHSDGIALWLDFNSFNNAFNHTGKLVKENLQYIHLIPGSKVEISNSYDVFNKPDSTNFMCIKTEKGYIAEVAIPINESLEIQKGEFPHFRFNITVSDYTSEVERDSYSWQPEWRSKKNVLGSGMFLIKR